MRIRQAQDWLLRLDSNQQPSGEQAEKETP